ncbi:TIGR04219 family outer membrane beta-barrel protein [Bermanella sp. WJH001]|uniref:TIGR04219 family outer membrane beta-barrel protein n=1 Tax=Bermanella sp. WJH001 TaxID=3048005 RepID=UPI0024BE0993|nr:TIGR04219 family outer membrane beta-barrel protein [Bermanella sp. WJH001]MDJ1537694.1 TIGR04219 family outer membrane beta-barrel protein [Bermanella sp. WJH001]
MKKILAAAVVAASLPQAASALPLVDFYAGGYYWDQTVSGDVVNGSADLDDNLGLKADGQSVLYVAFEHPIPVIPNVKIKQTAMDADGSGAIPDAFNFNGTSVDGSVDSTLDLSHTDFTLYWSLPLPIVTFDFGLTARQFDGQMTVVDNTGSDTFNASADFDFVVPMGYLNAGIDIPLTGLSVAANINTISYGDTSLTDFDANLTYVLPVIPLLDVGITAGYRSFDLKLDEADFGDLSAEATVAGPYLGLSLHL